VEHDGGGLLGGGGKSQGRGADWQSKVAKSKIRHGYEYGASERGCPWGLWATESWIKTKSYPSGAKARIDFATFAARLKSCPDTKRIYETRYKTTKTQHKIGESH
jgi:hypothetical protein